MPLKNFRQNIIKSYGLFWYSVFVINLNVFKL